MKATPFLALLVLVSPLAAQKERASDEKAPAVEPKKDLLPNQQAFLNLPQEKREEFVKHLTEAGRLFQQKRIFETLDELEKTVKIFPDSPEIYNLRGSCFVEMRAFDKALADYQKALTYSKDDVRIEFNVAEVYFVTKQWKKCLETFDKILKDLPESDRMSLGRLGEFKVFLCKKKLGKTEEAKKLAEKYDFMDDSPYYYYAQAALAYDAKDLVKAEEWLAMASRVFSDPNILAPWQDTMVEYGYIKSFYGDDAGKTE
jgi:tetratricopeptide (TPR) repeat protein